MPYTLSYEDAIRLAEAVIAVKGDQFNGPNGQRSPEQGAEIDAKYLLKLVDDLTVDRSGD